MRSRRQIRFLATTFLALVLFAACQSTPRIEYVMEVTKEVTVVVVVTATHEGDNAVASVVDPTITPTPDTASIAATPTTDPFPTPVNNQIIVAEQLFEHGRMFYLSPIREIWILYNDEDTTGGRWSREEDAWEEGMPEFDPSIEAPDNLYQPERGFGKLWRENDEIREALGWAREPEIGHITVYQYIAGGSVNAEGNYIAGPGYHTLNSHYGGTYIFSEAEGTWGIAAAPVQ